MVAGILTGVLAGPIQLHNAWNGIVNAVWRLTWPAQQKGFVNVVAIVTAA
jgi:hypothetical protein